MSPVVVASRPEPDSDTESSASPPRGADLSSNRVIAAALEAGSNGDGSAALTATGASASNRAIAAFHRSGLPADIAAAPDMAAVPTIATDGGPALDADAAEEPPAERGPTTEAAPVAGAPADAPPPDTGNVSEARADDKDVAAAAKESAQSVQQVSKANKSAGATAGSPSEVQSVEQEAERAEGAVATGTGAPPADGSALSSRATTALTVLAGPMTELAALASTSLDFVPSPEESVGDPDAAQRAYERRAAGGALISAVVARNVTHTQELLALASTVPARIVAKAEEVKAGIDAAVSASIQVVDGAVAAAIAAARGRAAAAKAQVGAENAATLATITQTTGEARTDVDTLFSTASGELSTLESSQSSSISKLYTEWTPRIEAVGTNVGSEAKQRAGGFAQARLAECNGESSLLDGPIHDNKKKAEAGAARDVGSAYATEFEKSGQEQAKAVAGGKQEVLDYVTQSATTARDTLADHKNGIATSLKDAETGAREQVEALAKQMLTGIDAALRATVGTLDQQRAADHARISGYGAEQKSAIDDQAAQAIEALVAGAGEATTAIHESVRGLLDATYGAEAPDTEELVPAVSVAQAETDSLAATLLTQLETGIANSEASLAAGGEQAVSAIDALGAGGAEQAQAAAAGHLESVSAMLAQAVAGFSGLRDGHAEKAGNVKDSARDGFAEATEGLRETFEACDKQTVGNFQNARAELGDELRKKSLPKMDNDIKEQAKKAADAVQPRWKSIVKWVITIAVIVAVIALTIVSAGALGVVGTILLGTALGAAAGAATTIGHNLVDGKEWSDGVVQAMVIGAIGGCFGGIGGALAGKVASVGLKFAIETGVDAVGGVIGELAVGNAITLEGVLWGAAIGAAVGGGMAGAGALKGKIKIRPNADIQVAAPKPAKPAPAAPAGSKSKTREFPERPTILKKTPDAPQVGSSAGKPGSPAAATRPKWAAAPSRPEPTSPKLGSRSSGEPSPPGGPPKKTGPGSQETSSTAGARSEPEAVTVKTSDGHEVTATPSGNIMRCSSCQNIRDSYADVLKSRPDLDRQLKDIENLASLGKTRQAARKARSLEKQMLDIEQSGMQLGGAKYSKSEIDAHLDAIAGSGKPLTPRERAKITKLAEDFGDAVRTNTVTPELRDNLERALARFDSQHIGSNPVLKEAWEASSKNLAKRPGWDVWLKPDGTPTPAALASPSDMKRLYAAIRGDLDRQVRIVTDQITDAFGTLKAQINGLGTNVEVHHLLYKAKFPEEAINPQNLVLALRKRGGPDAELHDLLHYLSSGAGRSGLGKNKWKVLLDDMSVIIMRRFNVGPTTTGTVP